MRGVVAIPSATRSKRIASGSASTERLSPTPESSGSNHGLRHTCATLLLAAGEPVHAVARRLGHADETETLRTNAHILPDMKREQAEKIGGILFG